ncbi:MAG: hypothetical protein ABR568_05165 [Pyrinomonadaceae bacterium]
MPLDERFFPDFLVVFLLEALLLVEAFEAELRLVEARLVPLDPARFFVEAALVFLVAVFLVLFLVPRVVDFLEPDRPLLDFLAADLLRAFVVGILFLRNALLSTVNFLAGNRSALVADDSCGIPAANVC